MVATITILLTMFFNPIKMITFAPKFVNVHYTKMKKFNEYNGFNLSDINKEVL